MPAVIRTASRKGEPRRAATRATYAPAKLKGAGAVGVDPRSALWAALALLCLILLLTMFTGGRAGLLTGRIGHAVDEAFARIGFKVKTVTVQGGTTYSNPYILRAAGFTPGQPILGLNLEEARERIEQVGWIKSARIIRLLPDTLVIAVGERPRLAVWQHGEKTNVVDKDGQIIPEADPGVFSDLPLIVGDGANEAAATILPEVAARPALMARLEALVRVDGRRWDLRLKDGGIIQLPADREDSALIQWDELDHQSHLLQAGFTRVDLRDPEMVTVRPRDAAPAAGSTPAGPAPVTAAPAAATPGL